MKTLIVMKLLFNLLRNNNKNQIKETSIKIGHKFLMSIKLI